MKIEIKQPVRRIASRIRVAIIRLISRPDFGEIIQIAHTIYDLAALLCKWLPELPPMP